MAIRIVCAGDCGVDYYVNDQTRWTGGCTLNVATNLCALAARDSRGRAVALSVVTVLGDDADSHDVQNQIASVTSDAAVQRAAGLAPLQQIELLPDGERRFRGYREGVLGPWRLDSMQRQALAAADLVMVPLFSQFSGAFAQIADVGRRNRLVVDFMDATDFGLGDPLVQALARHIHTGFFGLNAEDTAKIEAVRQLSRLGPGQFVVTLGKDGSILMQNGDIRHRCPAVPVYGAVNTTGAGDAFAAAYMHASQLYGTSVFALQRGAEHAAAVISGAEKVARFIGAGSPPLGD